jgi:hypothetical protein
MSNSDKKQLREDSHPRRRATDKKPQKLMLTIKDVAKLLHQRSRIDDEQYEMILKRGDAQAAKRLKLAGFTKVEKVSELMGIKAKK